MTDASLPPPELPVRPPAEPAAVLAPPIWRVMPSWQARLPAAPDSLQRASGFAAAAGVQDWVRYDDASGLMALVDGFPRPEQAPHTEELQPDPGQALLASFQRRGVSALRHTEGAWSMVLWDAASQHWLLAVDRLGRCPMAYRITAAGLEVRAGTWPAECPAEAEAGSVPWCPLAAGTHVRIACGKAVLPATVGQPAFHGTWPLEKRDRRPWSLRLGEFGQRLTSVLHMLEDYSAHVLLADDVAGGALLLQGMQRLQRLPAAVVWLPGWSDDGVAAHARRADWRALCAHFRVALLDVDALVETLPALRAVHPAAAAQPESASPMALISARSLEVLLPAQPAGWLARVQAWQPWRSDAPARPALHGAALARIFQTTWQPQLATALRAADLCWHVRWPLLDETVSQYLANLSFAARVGTPWQPGFRMAMLHSLLPQAVRRRLPGLT